MKAVLTSLAVLTTAALATFYIFRYGKLSDRWHGWPADTGMQTLREHLHREDLLP